MSFWFWCLAYSHALLFKHIFIIYFNLSICFLWCICMLNLEFYLRLSIYHCFFSFNPFPWNEIVHYFYILYFVMLYLNIFIKIIFIFYLEIYWKYIKIPGTYIFNKKNWKQNASPVSNIFLKLNILRWQTRYFSGLVP